MPNVESERDAMQARAETAAPVRPAPLPLAIVVERAYAQEGRGLTPGEVMRLASAVRRALSGEPLEELPL
jgi:hypothetical protein